MAFNEAIKERLNGVQIECRDAVEVIQSRDISDAFHYVDPPYVGSNCGHYQGYTQANFQQLIDLLGSVKGKFMLSSYPNEQLDKAVKKFGWRQERFEKVLAVNGKATNSERKKVEVITMNY